MRSLAIVALLACGCGYQNQYLDRSAPIGERVTVADVASVPVSGHRVVVVLEEGGSVEGELLAADELVYVLDASDGATVALKWGEIREVRVQIASSRPGEPAGSIVWTSLGTLSSLSHGVFLLASIPVWLGAGVPTSIVHGRAVWGNVTPEAFKKSLFQFARYPQGMPRELSTAARAVGSDRH